MKLIELLETTTSIVVITKNPDDEDFVLEIDPVNCNFNHCFNEVFLNKVVDCITAEENKLIVTLMGD